MTVSLKKLFYRIYFFCPREKIKLTETSHRGELTETSVSRPSRALRLYDQRKIPLHLF